MLAGLAGVVHDRQRADRHAHNRDEDNEISLVLLLLQQLRQLGDVRRDPPRSIAGQ